MNPKINPTSALLVPLLLLVTLFGCKDDNPFFNPDFLPLGESCFEGRETTQEVSRFQDPSLLDVLFVISNAPDTQSTQQRLAAAVPRFVSLLKSKGVDYRIGVVTGDARNPDTAGLISTGGQGIVGCEDSPAIVDDTAGDAAGTFVACNVLQGSQGSTTQEYMEAVEAALTRRATEPQSANAEFLRPRARLMVIVLADRDDCSNDDFDLNSLGANDSPSACDLANSQGNLTDPGSFVELLYSLKFGTDDVSFALVGGSDDGRDISDDETLSPTCSDSSDRPVFPSTRLLKVADLMHPMSVFESACAASYGLTIAHISRLSELRDVTVCAETELSGEPLSVQLDGEAIDQGEGGYVYLGRTQDCENGAISLSASRLAGTEGKIEISYCGR